MHNDSQLKIYTHIYSNRYLSSFIFHVYLHLNCLYVFRLLSVPFSMANRALPGCHSLQPLQKHRRPSLATCWPLLTKPYPKKNSALRKKKRLGKKKNKKKNPESLITKNKSTILRPFF